ncbi:hypothetical protein HYC85_013885 [Camellia sinensis]|uniref:Uncharacterized protein n=1 Tax=Camellia sinensis TaxID=4442 RepID=A0A7J7H848_CAMSI|nr:hypothetical protein HYC85_013885 [Camellia sinensis]
MKCLNRIRDLPIIARTAGKLAGRAIGYVQLARGQFDTIMHQTQARQVHKELQDTIAQLEAIRHEIRTVSFMNPGPLTRRLVDNLDQTSAASGNNEPEKPDTANRSTTPDAKNYSSTNSGFSDMHSQATAYAKLAESTAINSESVEILISHHFLNWRCKCAVAELVRAKLGSHSCPCAEGVL